MSETGNKPAAGDKTDASPETETDAESPVEERIESDDTMSETGNKPAAGDKTDASSEAETDAEIPVEEQLEPDDTDEISLAPKPRTFSAVAWLALLLALGASAGAGWLWWSLPAAGPQVDAANKTSVDALARSLGSVEKSIAAVEERIASSGEAESSRAAEVASVKRDLRLQLEPLESISGRLANLESSIASLRGISSGVRDTWLLAEAEYYLQIANAQLQLAGNPYLAGLALRLADEKVLQLANPALTGVRRAIAQELRALDSMERPDIEGTTLTLASLAGMVDALPLKSQAKIAGDDRSPAGTESGGVDRALASLKNALGSVVSVRQIDEAQRPFVAPEAEYFLRANLSLQLQAARVALLRGEKAVFDQSIDDAAAWLEQYYDADSTAVQNAIRTIREMETNSFAVASPDISGSLRLLRQFNTLTEYDKEIPVAPSQEPPAAPSIEPQPETESEQQTESVTETAQ